MNDREKTSLLLLQWQEGKLDARDRLIERIHPELAQIAAARLRRESQASFSVGDLINDAAVRLISLDEAAFANRAHILALASRIMRNILIDHARSKATDRRKHVKVELITRVDGEQRFNVAALEAALIRLEALDSQLMEMVEMRYFGGMTVEEVSKVTALSEATVKRRWQVARAWLMDALQNPIDRA